MFVPWIKWCVIQLNFQTASAFAPRYLLLIMQFKIVRSLTELQPFLQSGKVSTKSHVYRFKLNLHLATNFFLLLFQYWFSLKKLILKLKSGRNIFCSWEKATLMFHSFCVIKDLCFRLKVHPKGGMILKFLQKIVWSSLLKPHHINLGASILKPLFNSFLLKDLDAWKQLKSGFGDKIFHNYISFQILVPIQCFCLCCFHLLQNIDCNIIQVFKTKVFVQCAIFVVLNVLNVPYNIDDFAYLLCYVKWCKKCAI